MLPNGIRPLSGRSRQSPGPGFRGVESEKLLPEVPSCSPGSGCSSRRSRPADVTALSGSPGLPAESSPPLPYSSKEAGSRIQGPLLLGGPSRPLGLDCWALDGWDCHCGVVTGTGHSPPLASTESSASQTSLVVGWGEGAPHFLSRQLCLRLT